jgi:hypothetical protein
VPEQKKKKKIEKSKNNVLTQWLEYCATVTKVISSNLIHVYITLIKTILLIGLLCFSFLLMGHAVKGLTF